MMGADLLCPCLFCVVCPAAKLGNVKESLTLLKVFNMVQSLIAASVRGDVFELGARQHI
jgi:hypothetical protein